jgi:broad specificity phosphatase PhoE
VASPYRRTLETATIVGNVLGLSIAVEPLIRERCVFSCDEGTPPAQLAALWPDLDFAHLEERWWGVAAESEVSLGERCAAFRAKTDGVPDRSRIAVITHWGVIRALTGQELSNAACIRLS